MPVTMPILSPSRGRSAQVMRTMMQSRVEAMRVRREQIGNQCQRRLLVAGRLNADHLGSMHFLGRRPLQAGSGGEWLMTDGVSRYFIRSIEGLRVAIAGFPNATKVEVEEGVALNVSTLGELRALEALPGRLEILIPYRLQDDSSIVVRGMPEDYMSER